MSTSSSLRNRGGVNKKSVSNHSGFQRGPNSSMYSGEKLCQSRLACKGDKTAKFYCNDCGQEQCDSCEDLLHVNERFSNHFRQPVDDGHENNLPKEESSNVMCQGKITRCPGVKNADLYCKDCDLNLCHECFCDSHTSAKERKHSRQPLQAQTGNETTDESKIRTTATATSTTTNTTTATGGRKSISNRKVVTNFTDLGDVESDDEKGLISTITTTTANTGDKSGKGGKNKDTIDEVPACVSKAKKKNKSKKRTCNSSDASVNHHHINKSNGHLAGGGGSGSAPTSDEASDTDLPMKLLPDVAQMSLDPSEDFLTCDFDHVNGKLSTSSSPRSTSSSSDKNGDHIGLRHKRPSDQSHLLDQISLSPPHSPPLLSDGVQKSFLVLDEFERMQVTSSKEFAQKLGTDAETLVKVISIFGNTGEGKSHTFNHTFFDGNEVFKTSPAQSSCTIGIWAAYDPNFKVVCIDTEGLLGVSENNNRRTRLLLKVLAISDIVIYRTRAERLHNDLFTFLGDASRAYGHHFSTELRAASRRGGLSYSISDLGPVVVIFHETLHTEILRRDSEKSPEDELRRRFQTLNLSTESYSAFHYIGTRTKNGVTNFKGLQEAMRNHIENTTVRSARGVSVVFDALKHLNEKFSGDIEKTIPSTFPDEYFTCSAQCKSCNARCTLSMNHSNDKTGHKNHVKCKFQYQYNNQVYFCKACFDRGDEVMVTPKTSSCADTTIMGAVKYAWYGYVLECSRCGVIYRSRQYWFGNSDPFEVVRTEILHVWPGETNVFQSSQNAAQKVLDSLQYIASSASSISAKPTRQISSWVADKINPPYWVPNADITHCKQCEERFEDTDVKHHCRACGFGFCDKCSSKRIPVPEQGWLEEVRVCDRCYSKRDPNSSQFNDSSDLDGSSLSEIPASQATEEAIRPRKYAEVIGKSICPLVGAIEYPITWIKDSARPEYWEADKDVVACGVCSSSFAETKQTIHHCRACGKGVCDDCSQSKRPVPSRGWNSPVRVCNTCKENPSL